MDDVLHSIQVTNCLAEGPAPAIGPDIYQFNLDLEVDIGWSKFKVLFIDAGSVSAGCFTDLEQDESYPIGDFQVRIPPLSLRDWCGLDCRLCVWFREQGAREVFRAIN